LPGERLILFVKHPRPGDVKTRLAQDLGVDDAASLYQAMAEHVVRETTPAAGGYERLVRFAPAEAEDAIARWLPTVARGPQAAGDLGVRMADAFARAFGEGAGRVVLVGTDAPGLDRVLVGQAFGALRDHDVVIGPACDGGYYLIGLAAPCEGVFEGVAWSTPAVFAQTVARARALALRTFTLPELRDVDTLDDVRREWKRLAPLLEGREALRQRLERAL